MSVPVGCGWENKSELEKGGIMDFGSVRDREEVDVFGIYDRIVGGS
jgi:hypothetical protein